MVFESSSRSVDGLHHPPLNTNHVNGVHMNSLLNVLIGVVIGTYYAESIRQQVPLLDPSSSKTSDQEGGS